MTFTYRLFSKTTVYSFFLSDISYGSIID